MSFAKIKLFIVLIILTALVLIVTVVLVFDKRIHKMETTQQAR